LGAARWINEFPDRIFLDRECKTPLPLDIPSKEKRKFHGIVVARGAAAACGSYFQGGSGSLAISPALRGDDHLRDEAAFQVGDINPGGPFVHVLDEVTLDAVLQELDTVTDFTSYLEKKERLIRSDHLIGAAGDETF
jgi:hypothetical protein